MATSANARVLKIPKLGSDQGSLSENHPSYY